MSVNHSRVGNAVVWIVVVIAAVTCIRYSRSATPRDSTGASPGQVDLRGIFKSYGLDVRSQGSRGTCSVFTVTDAIEYALANQTRKGVRLSPEFLNWASNDAIKEYEDGGFFSDLWKGYVAHGICPQEDMPYQPAFDPKLRPSEQALQHARPLKDAKLRLHWIKEWNVNTGLTDAHLAEIKRTLTRQWPVCGGFRWPKQEVWQDGVMQMAPPEGVRDGHSILLVGFRDDPKQPGGGVFIFRNTAKSRRDGLMTYEYAKAYMNDAAWIDYAGAGVPGAASPAT
ncbi:MAG: C1 family peptidase, partial [Tepidisphaeraceae bacterium]